MSGAAPTIAYLQQCLQTPELQAFLRVVRAGESHPELDEAYRALYGWRPGNGKVFTSWTDHPRMAFMSSWGWTSAAGAYQAMCAVPGKVKTDTWGDFGKWCATQGHVPDFTPAGQDLFGAWCVVVRRKAMPALLARDLEHAMGLCNREWASLPGSPYGQPLMTMDKARAVWSTWLPRFEAAAPPAPAPAPMATPAPETAPTAPPAQPQPHFPSEDDLQSGRAFATPQEPKPMMPVIAIGAKALLSGLAGTLIEAFTPLAKEKLQAEIGRHTDRPEIVEQITSGVIAAAKAATGLADPVQAVAAVAKDPVALQQVEQSSLETLSQMAPLLDQLAKLDTQRWAADDASQAAAAERAKSEANDIAPMLATYAVRGLYAMIALVGLIVIAQVIWTPDHKPSGELLTLLGALMMLAANKTNDVYSYRFGTTRQSAAKDAVISDISRRK